MSVFKVINNVYSVGVKDPGLRVFDIMMETKMGTTYNSYLILEKGGITIIDGVKIGFTDEWLNNLRSLVKLEDIKYLVSQHTEPDHSGSIPALLAINPHIQVFGSFMAMQNMKDLNNAPFNSNVVKPGQELKLSEAHSLFFYPVPNVHWPDTIITHDPKNNVAYTCDFLGMHISPEQLFLSKEPNQKLADDALTVYYDAIMAPFKGDCLKAVKTLESLNVDQVLNSHGYILDTKKAVDHAIASYIKWSTIPKSDKLVVTLVYSSAYGYTTAMKDVAVETLKSLDVEVNLFKAPEDSLVHIVESVEKSDALLLASPTFVGDGIKPIFDVLNSLNPYIGQGKYVSAFGSYGWSGEAVKNYLSRAKELRMKTVDEGHRMRLKPTPEKLALVKDYITNFVNLVKQEVKK